MNVYALKLENNKYYIGKTNKDVVDRYNEHLAGNGSEWTRLYKPIGIVKSQQSSSIFDEDNITKEYMMKYGIDNVRGSATVHNF